MNPTIDYYNRQAAAFFRETVGVEVAALQRRFTALSGRPIIPPPTGTCARHRKISLPTATTGDCSPMLMDCRHTAPPYFPKLRIACGHFKAGRADNEEYRSLGPGHGKLDPARHFIAKTGGNYMNGGKKTIRGGDYQDLEADETMRTFARLKAVLKSEESMVS